MFLMIFLIFFFGIFDVNDLDFFGVIGFEMVGIEICEVGFKLRLMSI